MEVAFGNGASLFDGGGWFRDAGILVTVPPDLRVSNFPAQLSCHGILSVAPCTSTLETASSRNVAYDIVVGLLTSVAVLFNTTDASVEESVLTIFRNRSRFRSILPRFIGQGTFLWPRG